MDRYFGLLSCVSPRDDLDLSVFEDSTSEESGTSRDDLVKTNSSLAPLSDPYANKHTLDKSKGVAHKDLIIRTTQNFSHVHTIYCNITSSESNFQKKTFIAHIPYCSDADKSLHDKRLYRMKAKNKNARTKSTGIDRCNRLFQLSQQGNIEGKKRREKIQKSSKSNLMNNK